jgi:hypothetical protein
MPTGTPGVLRKLGSERHVRPGEVEGPTEKIAAEAILAPLELCGWDVRERPRFGTKSGSTP